MTSLTNPLFLNTILLGGSTDAKLAAACAAGFDQVELWRQDIEAANNDSAAVAATLRRLDLALTDYQVLLDFDGAPDTKRESKRAEARHMLDTAVIVGAKTVLTPASTDVHCVPERIEEDLRWLAREAGKRGLRIAYEAMAWSTVNHFTPDAWRTIQNVGEDNIGMVIDAFHIFVKKRTARDLDGIPADKIFLVQFSDLADDPTPENLIDTARHRRLLPGEGHFPVMRILEAVLAKGYTGPIGLEVFNDDIKALPPEQAAVDAMKALRSLIDAANR